MAARARSPGATSACRSRASRRSARKRPHIPVITGPRTLFEVETPRARLALTYHHRSRRWTITGLDEDRARRRLTRAIRIARHVRRRACSPATPATSDPRGGCAGTALAPSPTADPGRGMTTAPSRPATATYNRRVHEPGSSVPRPDRRRVRRPARVGRAGPRRGQRLGRGREPRCRPRRDGRGAVRRTARSTRSTRDLHALGRRDRARACPLASWSSPTRTRRPTRRSPPR